MLWGFLTDLTPFEITVSRNRRSVLQGFGELPQKWKTSTKSHDLKVDVPSGELRI